MTVLRRKGHCSIRILSTSCWYLKFDCFTFVYCQMFFLRWCYVNIVSFLVFFCKNCFSCYILYILLLLLQQINMLLTKKIYFFMTKKVFDMNTMLFIRKVIHSCNKINNSFVFAKKNTHIKKQEHQYICFFCQLQFIVYQNS